MPWTYIPAIVTVLFIVAVLPIKPTRARADRYCRKD